MSWPLVKIGEVCNKVTDGSHNPPKGIDTSEYIMLSSKNVFDDQINFENPRYLSAEDFNNENRRTDVSVGDVLLTIVGTVGRAAVVNEEHGKFTLQRSVAVLKPNERIESRFLMYCLRSMLHVLTANSRGVAQKGIYLKQIKELEIPLPPLDEQKRIAAILDKADAIRRKRQQAIKFADDFLRSLFLDMFGDPVTNPKGWEVRRFSELCKCSQGMQVDSKLQKDSAENGYVKFLRIINYTQSSNEFKFIPTPSTDKALIKRDDIVMVRYGATAGFVGRGLGGVLANNLFKISFEKSVLDNEYFYYLLNSDYFQNILRSNKKGGAMPAISFGQLNDIEIMIPSLQEQSKFSQVVNIISNIKGHSIGSAFLSDDSFDALSQAAFSGEL